MCKVPIGAGLGLSMKRWNEISTYDCNQFEHILKFLHFCAISLAVAKILPKRFHLYKSFSFRLNGGSSCRFNCGSTSNLNL